MKNGVILISYADSLGGDLKSLHSNLNQYFKDCVSGIHILPFFPSSGDRGFSPVTYSKIDPSFGNWDDLEALGNDYEIMADFMVNHISRRSDYFNDWVENENDSKYADLFLQVKNVFGTDTPSNDILKKIYRRQPGPPWRDITLSSGKTARIWCTFSDEQIDIDIESKSALMLFTETLKALSERGIKTIRLDAVGYITKKSGTSCFMVEPDIWNILFKLKKIAKDFNIDLLPEMHEHYSIQLKMAEKGFYVYDFALPMLLLYAWYGKDFEPLKRWFSICPQNQFTTLDTHDGIGVVDAADLLSKKQSDFTVNKLYAAGSNIKRKYSGAEYNNLDIYQINCTFYSALGENDNAYIIARAIQFFAPGIPQVYYVGMLAGKNDLDLVEETKNGRDINRHNYTSEEILENTEREVVKRLKKLMKFRQSCKAFDGTFEMKQTDSKIISISRKTSSEIVNLTVDLNDNRVEIFHINNEGKKNIYTP